jgi:CBS domain-containing protein
VGVEEIMSHPVFTCSVGDSLNEAARLMWERDVGAVPVVDDQGRVAGVITDRDICMAAYTQGLPLQAIPVASAMATEVFSCRPGDSIPAAEKIMRDKQVRRIPIVNGAGEPIGILTLNDLARKAESSGGRRMNGAGGEVLHTLAAVCASHRGDARSA